MIYVIKTPIEEDMILKLRAGDEVILSGKIYGARDAAHKRIFQSMENGKPLPFNLKQSSIFYVGPSPAPPGKICGSIGPTTSARMDIYAEDLLKKGARIFIGKGARDKNVKELLKKYKGAYLVAVGGISALLSKKVTSIKAIAYQDLGPEAIHEIVVKDLPLFVAYDTYGGDIFKDALLKE